MDPVCDPLVESATDAGYHSIYKDLFAGDGYVFARPGDKFQINDEIWQSGSGPWECVTKISTLGIGVVGVEIDDSVYPIRRPIMKAGPLKWKCRHLRLPANSFCPVCSAVYGRFVDE